MLFHRRSWIALAVVVACATGIAHAQQDYPNRLVQIINPYQAGGTTDALARGLAAGLSSRLGQQFVVINKPGAGGALGTASVARADPDGYTLLFAPALVLSVLPQARPRSEVGYDPESLIPVCQTFSNTMGLLVRGDSPIKSLNDLVAAAREKPSALTYGHQGVSTIPQLAMEEFLDAAKIKITGVPYRGDPAAITDLIGGRLDTAAVVLGAVGLTGQNVRIIGVFSDERHTSFPDAPTVPEQGFNVTPTSFGGILVPRDTPPAIVDKLASACEGAAKDDAYVTAAQRAAQPARFYADRAAFRERLARDIEVKKRLLQQLGQAATD